MSTVKRFIQSVTPDAFNAAGFLKFVIVFALGILILSVLGRLIFGKKSTLNRSVSCAISILCIYVVNITAYSTGIKLNAILSPLPFVGIHGDYLVIYDLLHSGFSTLCAHMLDMLMLAFLVGLLDSWLPEGKKLLSWFGFRILSVILAICLHYVLCLILKTVLPGGLFSSAPVVLVIVIIAALLLGALKVVIGGALAIFAPVLAILYAFFFKNLVGKQLTKAIFTTAILTAFVYLLNYLGVTAVYIGSAVLIAYLPLLLLVLLLWYVISHLL